MGEKGFDVGGVDPDIVDVTEDKSKRGCMFELELMEEIEAGLIVDESLSQAELSSFVCGMDGNGGDGGGGNG